MYTVLMVLMHTVSISKTTALQMEVIKSLLDFYNKPAIVYALTCNREDLLFVVDKFNKEGYPTSELTLNSLNKITNTHQNCKTFVINVHCQNIKEVLKLAEEKYFLTPPFRWIIYYNRNLISPEIIIKKYFRNSDMQLNSDITLLGSVNDSVYTVDKIYRFKKKYDVEIEKLGLWSNTTDFARKFFDYSLGKFRYNLKGRMTKSLLYLHFLKSVHHLIDKREKNEDSKAKVDYALTLLLADTLNSTLDCEMAFIYDYMSGNWTLPSYACYRGVDYAASGLAIGDKLFDIVDFTDGTSYLRYKLLLEQPKLSSIENLYILPFTSLVWSITILTVIVMMVLTFFAIKVDYLRGNGNNMSCDWFDTAYSIYTEICKQGSSGVPNSIGGKIAAIVLMFFILFLHTSYSANITSLLNSATDHITELEDILKHNVRVWMDAASIYIYSLGNQTDTIREKVMIHNVDPVTTEMEEGMPKLHEPQTAYQGCIDDILPVIDRTFSDNEKCRLSSIDFLGSPVAFFTIPKNSTLKEALKIKMKQIIESGMKQREFKLLYSEMPQCMQSSVFVDVSLQDCYFAFAVLAGGIAAAILIFLLEYYKLKFQRRCRKVLQLINV